MNRVPSEAAPHVRLYPLAVAAHTGVCALGRGRAAITAALRTGRCGLRRNDFGDSAGDVQTFIGEVMDVESLPWPSPLQAWDCRNNRLAHMALYVDGFAEAVAERTRRLGAARIGVFVGTSTSGILDTEEAFRAHQEAALSESRYVHRHSLAAISDFVASVLGLQGPRHCVSTACSSSAKVYASAARAIALGLCDAAVVGGVDSLCYTTLYGFNSLELLSPQPAQPMARTRSGISIGEGAAFALLVRDEPGTLRLAGVGESSDGYHMATPHPQGIGAERAIRDALDSAGLQPSEIAYANLHGTGTPANDLVEAAVMQRLFGSGLACSSTKGATGHCLGAAGALEALICQIALGEGLLPANVGTSAADVAFDLDLVTAPRDARLQHVMSNSFGFGGSNCTLIFGAAAGPTS